MLPTIQEQLQFLERTINPNYLIIIQNKANENMDFSQFRIAQPEVKEKKVVEKRYIVTSIDWSETQVRILVKDSWFNDRIVYECTCKKEHLESNLDKAKKAYRTDTLEKI